MVDSADISAFVRAYQQGRNDVAEQLAREHLAAHPDAAMAMNVLGLCLLGRGCPGDASRMFEALALRHPDEALYWSNLGTALRSDGRPNDAERAYAAALRLAPNNPRFLANMGFLKVAEKRVIEARDLLWRVFLVQPTEYKARVYAAMMCRECGEDERARRLLHGWERWLDQLDGIMQVELAAQLVDLGESAVGEALLRRHLDDSVTGAAARARLAMMLERFNRLEEARALLIGLPSADDVADVELRSEIVHAHALVAARDKDATRARALLEDLLKGSDVERWRTMVCFLLARLCDKQDDVDACMEYLHKAHANQMKVAVQLVPELVAPDANPLGIADCHVTRQEFEQWGPVAAPAIEDSPIFVVGFPRSGTTMLEQMLDAHPDMTSMDERAFVQAVIEHMGSMGLRYPQQLGDLTSAQCDALREVYWRAVADVVSIRPGQRLVDKNPLTMLRLPLLVRLFPNARIILVVRHPCDVLLSCYMQHFTAPAFAALCSSLPRLATGYAGAMRFWNIHAALLRPHVYEWRYEDAVRDFGTSVEKLGSFLQLGDATPLYAFSEHARHKGYISTPSYTQVVQPVYASSINRWHRYRRFFEPVLTALEPAMRRFGYDA